MRKARIFPSSGDSSARAVYCIVSRCTRCVLPALAVTALVACQPSSSRDRKDTAQGPPSPAQHSNRPYEVWSSRNGRLIGRLVAARSPIQFGGQTFDSEVYNGQYLAPLLRVRPGDSLKLRVVNRLADISNMHYHGTEVSPRVGMDNIFMHIAAADSFDYALYFPPDHNRGLFWYHPHPHGYSERQVLGGMSGLLVVEGLLEEFYPWLRHVPEQILMLKALIPPGQPDGAPHVKNINGLTQATFTIRPGELQLWRIGNIAADAYFSLRIDGHRFWLLAQDANALPRPLLLDSLYLPPGARAEVLIEGAPPGSYAIRHDSVDTGPQGDPNPAVVLGALVSAGTPVSRSADLQRLRTMAPLSAVAARIDTLKTRVMNRRVFDFSETADGQTFFINGKQFDPNRTDTTVELGAVEEWTLRNLSGEVHTFHIHQTDFLVTEINGAPQPANGLHDTINMPYAMNGQPGVVKIILPFTNPNIVGSFVYHCHILEHEDGGMMQRIQVVPTRAPTTVAR